MKSSSNKKVAVTFVLEGTIIGNDCITFLRLRKALNSTFPAAKVTDLKIMSAIENINTLSSNES